jgi:hypothetical protein
MCLHRACKKRCSGGDGDADDAVAREPVESSGRSRDERRPSRPAFAAQLIRVNSAQSFLVLDMRVASIAEGKAMHSRVWTGLIAFAAIAFMALPFAMQMASPNYGAGWWGPGMMGGYAMGPGSMSGYGSTAGYNGAPPIAPGFRPGQGGNLSVDDVKTYFGRWLAWQGNPRVKLGNVAEKDADTITADILTTDKDGLVQRFAVDRHTGFMQQSED